MPIQGVVSMSKHVAGFLALCVVLAVVLPGCSMPEQTTDVSMDDEPSASETAGETEGEEFEWLNGGWTVTTELIDIDNTMMTSAADQPGAEWECIVEGSAMTLLTDRHEYSGELSGSSDGDWAYEGVSTYTDEEGTVWTSDITVTAARDSEDSFSGQMEGTISSDAYGHLYTATWDITGRGK